jgi:molybdate transport system substrate-binding protein
VKWLAGWVWCLGLAQAVSAAEVKVAVAANFAPPLAALATVFQKETGHTVSFAAASTAKLYAQIRHGAPFEVLLSADAETPARLEAEGLGVLGSRFTYATGALVLWSPKPAAVDAEGKILYQPGTGKVAIANPKLAPYGRAAQEALTALGRYDALKPRFVMGENIGQTFQFVASGNAAMGLVAAAQVMQAGKLKGGSAWQVPQNLYAPIRQDAILLKTAADNAAARALMRFLREPAARSIIQFYGYQ